MLYKLNKMRAAGGWVRELSDSRLEWERKQGISETTPRGPIEINTTVSALALAWVAKNTNNSTVILGASNPEQVT